MMRGLEMRGKMMRGLEEDRKVSLVLQDLDDWLTSRHCCHISHLMMHFPQYVLWFDIGWSLSDSFCHYYRFLIPYLFF